MQFTFLSHTKKDDTVNNYTVIAVCCPPWGFIRGCSPHLINLVTSTTTV